MALRVKPTPTRFPASSLSTPMDNTLLHSISSVCHPCGRVAGIGKVMNLCAVFPPLFISRQCISSALGLPVVKLDGFTSILLCEIHCHPIHNEEAAP